MFLLPLISLAQPAPCETYTSGNYDYPSCSGNTSTCATSYSGTATVIYSSPGSISIVPGTGFSAGTFSGNGYFKVLASSLNGGTASETNVSCYGGSNGTATANPSAGYTPYTYLWSNSKTTQIISGLTAATYTCTITDGQGQTASVSATVTQPANGGTASSTPVPISACHGGSGGTATATPSACYTPCTYKWSNSKTTQTITGLTAGTYTCTLTNTDGLTASVSTTVGQPGYVTAAVSNLSGEPSCDNLGTGTMGYGVVQIIPAGGTPPYSCSGCNYGSMEYQNTPGNYSVTITDKNHCPTSPSSTGFYISDYTITSVSIINGSDNNYYLGDVATEDGTIFKVEGTSPNQYWESNENTWDTRSTFNVSVFEYETNSSGGTDSPDPGDVTPDTKLASPTTYGWVSITIQDAQAGCAAATIDNSGAINPNSNNNETSTKENTTGLNTFGNNVEINVYPNPAQTLLHISCNTSIGDAQIKMFDISGRLVYDENLNGNTITKDVDVSNFAKGAYQLQIVGNRGIFNKKVIVE
jgi:hypothetical protein